VVSHWQKQKKQPLAEVENGENVVREEYNAIGSFTQLLTAPTCDYDNVCDGSIF
jgi:hypothetical protein